MIACTAPPSWYWKLESTLLVLWRQRCVQAGHWTVHTQLIFLHDQKMFEAHFQDSIGHCCAAPFCALAPAPRPASASPVPREDLLLLPILHFRLRASKVSFCTLRKHARLADAPLSHSCSCWISHGRASNSTMSICNLRNSFHELHCSCHRNSCPELVFLSCLSCCLHSSDA